MWASENMYRFLFFRIVPFLFSTSIFLRWCRCSATVFALHALFLAIHSWHRYRRRSYVFRVYLHLNRNCNNGEMYCFYFSRIFVIHHCTSSSRRFSPILFWSMNMSIDSELLESFMLTVSAVFALALVSSIVFGSLLNYWNSFLFSHCWDCELFYFRSVFASSYIDFRCCSFHSNDFL